MISINYLDFWVSIIRITDIHYLNYRYHLFGPFMDITNSNYWYQYFAFADKILNNNCSHLKQKAFGSELLISLIRIMDIINLASFMDTTYSNFDIHNLN